MEPALRVQGGQQSHADVPISSARVARGRLRSLPTFISLGSRHVLIQRSMPRSKVEGRTRRQRYTDTIQLQIATGGASPQAIATR